MQTKLFDSFEEIDDYVRTNDYATGDRRLCFGVVVTKNSNHEYEYHLRWNISRLLGNEDIPKTTNAEKVKVVEK